MVPSHITNHKYWTTSLSLILATQIHVDNSQIYISSLGHSSVLQTHMANLLLSISIWMADRYPKLNQIGLLLSTIPNQVLPHSSPPSSDCLDQKH